MGLVFVGDLVGRDQVVAQLELGLDAAAEGRGRLVLIAGEPGIGKTTVLSALADQAVARSATVTWGQCWDGEGVPAFWPWMQVVRAVAPHSGEDLGEVRRLMPESGGLSEPAVDGGSAARFGLFDAVVRLLADAARGHGLVVVLDDLQWADEASLLLLEFASRHLRRAGVLLIGAYRDVEAGSVLERVAGAGEVIMLDGLSPSDAEELVGRVAGRQLPSDVVADVTRRAGGNPLFVRELTRLVTVQPATSVSDLHRVLTGVSDVVERRLDRLSPECREVLDIASVLGREVRTDVVARARGGASDLANVLAEAVRARVLTAPPRGIGPHVFAHDLFREVVLDAMPATARARLHLAVARSLQALDSHETPVAAAELAAHFVAAAAGGLHEAEEDAVRYSQAAAEEAARCLAFEDAGDHLERALLALDLAESPSPAIRLELLLALGTARNHAGSSNAARNALAEGAALARRRGDAVGLGRAAIGIHGLGALSGMSRADTVGLLEEAARALEAEPSALRASVLACLSRELHHSWDSVNLEIAPGVAQDAVTLARELGDPATLAFCLLAMHDAHWSVGSASQRLPLLAEMLDLASAAGDRELLAQARLLEATALLELGDPAARSQLDRYCRAADELGHARGRWGALSRRAASALLAGQLERAARLGADAARLGAEIGEPDAPGVSDTLRFELARFQGGWSDLEPRDYWVPAPDWPPLRSLLSAARGDHQTARAELAGFSIGRQHDHGVGRHDGWPLVVIAEAVAVAGEHHQQVEAYTMMLPLAGTHIVYGGCIAYGGAVDHYLGVLATALGRTEEAIVHLRNAATAHETLGARAWTELDRALLSGLDVSPATDTHEERPRKTNLLRREGDTWLVRYRGRTTRVRHLKGLLDLARLLQHPGQEVLCIELMGGVNVGGSPGAALDQRARRAYETRVHELQGEIEDAKTANDWPRAERAELELDALVEQLAQAFGLGGRERTTGAATERARSAVTSRIRAAIRRVGENDPDVARHLANAVKTGTWCVYRPETGTEWLVEPTAHEPR
jgi:hypothetical protein